MKEHVIKFFQFLEAKEGKNAPLDVKILNPSEFKITTGDLYVDGYLDLSGTNIKSLPNGLNVSEYLDLYGCTLLTSLPDDLYVGGHLNLNGCTSLKSLPDGLQVDGSLFLRETPLADMYNRYELRDMIEASDGYVEGRINI